MSTLSKNIAYNLFGNGLLLVVSFVAVRYIYKQLGKDAFGLIYFALMLNTMLSATLTTGIGVTTVREVSAHLDDEPDYVHALIRTASLAYWSAYVIFGVGLCLVAPLLVRRWLHLETLDSGTATLVLQIMCLGALSVLPKSLYASLFRGLQRMEFNNLIDVVTKVLQQGGIVLIILAGGGLLHVTYWLAISFGLGILAYLLVLQRFFPRRAFLPGYCAAVVRRNWNYVSQMTMASLFGIAHTQGDKVTVSKLLPVDFFGYYTFAYGLVGRALLFRNAVCSAAFPFFAALFERGDRKGMLAYYRRLHDMLCFGIVPLLAAIPFMTLPVFGMVFNQEVARLMLLPITFITLGFYMNITLGMPDSFALAVGRPDIANRTNFYALFIVLPATIALIYFFGLKGGGLSWVFYHLFTYAYFIPRICTECLDLPLRLWYWHVLRIMALTSGTYGVAWFLLCLGGKFTLLALASAYVTASLIFLVVAYQMVGEDFRKDLVRFLGVVKKTLSWRCVN